MLEDFLLRVVAYSLKIFKAQLLNFWIWIVYNFWIFPEKN